MYMNISLMRNLLIFKIKYIQFVKGIKNVSLNISTICQSYGAENDIKTCSHLLKHFDKYKILTNLNHGFRSGFSTETQLLVTMHDLLKFHDKNIQTDIAILDYSEAFDTVPKDILLHKMNAHGVQGRIHDCLSSFFLKNRHMNVVVEGGTLQECIRIIWCAPGKRTWTAYVFLSH